jgi:hypothetical protein
MSAQAGTDVRATPTSSPSLRSRYARFLSDRFSGALRVSHRKVLSAAIVIIVALAVLVAADLGAGALRPHLRQALLWPTPEMQDKFDQITSAHPAGRGGTVLFGDSLMDVGADPADMAGAVYNASLAGEVLPVVAEWAAKVVVPRLKPSTVVIGFSVEGLNSNIPSAASVVDAYQKSRVVKAVEHKGDLTDQLDYWLRQHVSIYAERTVLRAPLGSEGSTTYDPPLSSLGWNDTAKNYPYGSVATPPAAAVAEVRYDLLNDYSASPALADELGLLINELRSAGTHVVFVAPPVSPEFIQGMPGGQPAYEQELSDMLALARDHGAQVLDAGIWPQAYFVDAAHLNDAGTNTFSTWLSGELAHLRGSS